MRLDQVHNNSEVIVSGKNAETDMVVSSKSAYIDLVHLCASNIDDHCQSVYHVF
jgi:hypothetical protein